MQKAVISNNKISWTDMISDSEEEDDLLLNEELYNGTYIKKLSEERYLERQERMNMYKVEQEQKFANKNYKSNSCGDYYITNEDRYSMDIANHIIDSIEINYQVDDEYHISDVVETLYDMDQSVSKAYFKDDIQKLKNMTKEKLIEIFNSEKFQENLLNKTLDALNHYLSRD